MKIFTKYTSMADYLQRFTILKIGRLHVRLHRISDMDGTPFLHSHPFAYITVVFKSSYID